MTAHQLRVLRYQAQNILNDMDAKAYHNGVFIVNGEDFAKMIESIIQLINENLKEKGD